MALTSGTKLGPYEIQSPLGAGGMGEVYRAMDTRLDRAVAIKVLPAHLSSDPDLEQRLEREAKTISSLRHVNICTLYDIGTQGDTDFVVMEYLEGQTLADRLQKGPLPIDQLLKIATEIAQALEKAHQRGIIHRDLKPANIMLTKAGAKLMDFGLAKPMLPNALQAVGTFTPSTPTMNLASLTFAASPLTQKGSIVGTFQYMAPEVLQGADSDQVSKDGGTQPVWSKDGKTLYYLDSYRKLTAVDIHDVWPGGADWRGQTLVYDPHSPLHCNRGVRRRARRQIPGGGLDHREHGAAGVGHKLGRGTEKMSPTSQS
jgi:serine/threonine protein kinase